MAAVSGGPDSCCLLHVLASLREELSLAIQVAHLDHGLREDSAADALYVKQLAEGWGLPVRIQRADVKGYRREKGLGLEEAAREVRYRFLAGVAGEFGTPFIVTGHTMNDQAETVLLHIIRGTGLKGLIGLKSLSPWTDGEHRAILVRPLLKIKRAETENYCRQAALEPRQDATNLLLAPLRNRIRLKLLPELKEYNPGIEEALLRLAATAEGDLAYLEAEIDTKWGLVVREGEEAVALDKAALRGLAPALQRHFLRRVIERLPGGLRDVEMSHIESLVAGLDLRAGLSIALPHGIIFAVDYNCYWLGLADSLPSPYPALPGESPLNIPGITQLPGWRVEASIVTGRPSQTADGFTAYLDAASSGEELAVRSRQRGDGFVPLGMAREKKLGEFMIAAKIPRRWRKHLPLVVSPRQIVWLVGHRLDERVKVTAETKKVLRLEFKKG